jgi:hypothetical protein
MIAVKIKVGKRLAKLRNVEQYPQPVEIRIKNQADKCKSYYKQYNIYSVFQGVFINAFDNRSQFL